MVGRVECSKIRKQFVRKANKEKNALQKNASEAAFYIGSLLGLQKPMYTAN